MAGCYLPSPRCLRATGGHGGTPPHPHPARSLTVAARGEEPPASQSAGQAIRYGPAPTAASPIRYGLPWRNLPACLWGRPRPGLPHRLATSDHRQPAAPRPFHQPRSFHQPTDPSTSPQPFGAATQQPQPFEAAAFPARSAWIEGKPLDRCQSQLFQYRLPALNRKPSQEEPPYLRDHNDRTFLGSNRVFNGNRTDG
jgi:hypothetical protein